MRSNYGALKPQPPPPTSWDSEAGTPSDTAARCNSMATAGVGSEGLGCVSQQMEQYHDSQDSDWFGRRGDRHSRLDVECVGLSRRRWLRSRLWWAALWRRRLWQGLWWIPRP